MSRTERWYWPTGWARRAEAILAREPYTAVWLRSVHARMDATVPDGATVFLGDSHLMGLCAASVEPLSVNFSIGGQRTDHLLAAMDYYPCLRRARRVVLMIGTNDLLQGRLHGLRERYEAILARIPCEVLVCGIPPLDGKEMQQGIADAVECARQACSTHPIARFLDVREALSGHGVLAADRLHLTPLGYSHLALALRSALHAA